MINVIPSEDIQRVFEGMVKPAMTRAEQQARVERLKHDGLITCTDCGATYRMTLFIYPEALCRDNDWCDCKVGKAMFTTLVEVAK